MHLSLRPFCCICASSQQDASLTRISSEKGLRENLETLLDQYIVPVLLLSKDDKLCVCDTCKTRLFEWDIFINTCKIAQKRFKDSLATCNHTDLPTCAKTLSASENAVSLVTEASPPHKKKSSNYCIAQWCNQGNYQGVSLFRLPKERERALLWLTEAGRSDLKSLKNLRSLYLCGNHFTRNMFTNNARNQLVKTAVPKIFPKPNYADKIALKGAASQIYPSQFKGVQLKSILPKVGLSNSVSPTTYRKVAMKAVPKPKAGNSLHPIVMCLSSQTAEETLSVGDNQNSCLLFGSPSQSSTSHESIIPIVNSSLPLTGIDAVSQNDNFAILSPSSTCVKDPYNTNTLYSVVKPSNSMKTGSAVLESSSSPGETTALMTKVRSSNAGRKEQKQYLEELESCFASDTFNSSALMDVQEFKNTSLPLPKQVYQNSSSEICQLQSLSQTDTYKSIAGSQDFLLPHISENIATSYSESSVHASDESTHSVSREPNPILNPNNELNSPHIGIFDLPSDDIQGTESSFINTMENLDELMDLDKYFEGR
ncbi:uncharacterized protein LOC117639938 isoform X2 [Thrips palmi]|nr:uncharacterized protein LOC117639938 isoform X2 [Thrips palmi]